MCGSQSDSQHKPVNLEMGRRARKALGCDSATMGLMGESRALGTSPKPQALSE